MRHARNRSTQGRSLVVAITLGALAVALAACSGTAAAPVTTPAPERHCAGATPRAPPTAAPHARAAPASSSSSRRRRSRRASSRRSTATRIDLPDSGGGHQVRPATERWDGTSAIASDGPMVDQFRRTGSRLAFILSAPTDLDLDAWAAAVHAKAVQRTRLPRGGRTRARLRGRRRARQGRGLRLPGRPRVRGDDRPATASA